MDALSQESWLVDPHRSDVENTPGRESAIHVNPEHSRELDDPTMTAQIAVLRTTQCA